MSNPQVTQTADAKVVRPYPGDLTELEKAHVQGTMLDEYALAITFQHHPAFELTIRRQDIFHSGAQVIVNAANTHLGGGGGIDGAIYRHGGADYANAHHALQQLYRAHYVQGHAAMIESGSLKQGHRIDNVIVVAGPQGSASPEKESELYSCYFNSLLLAHSQRKTSLAFPSISTGIFGFPKDKAASVSLKAVSDFIQQYPDTPLKTVSIHFLPSDPLADLETYLAAVSL